MKSVSSVSPILILALAVSGTAFAQASRHGYVDILVKPPVSTAAAAATETPLLAPDAAAVVPPASVTTNVLAQYKVSDEVLLALEAARLDAEATRTIIEQRRATGGLDQSQYKLRLDDYRRAISAYDQLSQAGADISSDEQAEALRSQLVSFNGGGQYHSVMASVGVRRGERGEVLVERASLEQSVNERIAELRASLPTGVDTRPAEAYLDYLQKKTLNRIRRESAVSDALQFGDAVVMVQPVQQTQALMMSGPPSLWYLDLHLRTTPSDAAVAFTTLSGYEADYQSDSTNTVMRGLLEYTVTKPGYKPVKGKNLNLVTATKGEFTCALVPTTSANPATLCQAR